MQPDAPVLATAPFITLPARKHRALVQQLTATTRPVGSHDRRLPGKARRKARHKGCGTTAAPVTGFASVVH